MNNPFKSAIDAIRNRGTHSGLNQTSNTAKMTAYITGPFIIGWFVVNILVAPQYRDLATFGVFGVWIGYVVLLYAKQKAESASYLPFPQSHWRFPDGQQVSFDLLVPPAGWEEILKYKDGSRLYRVTFKDYCEYMEADRDYPDVFKKALWKLPAEWNTAFKRTGHGEFFFENIFVDHPACENIEVDVIEWDERGKTRIPVCVISACSYIYEKVILASGRTFPATGSLTTEQGENAVIRDLKNKIKELTTRNRYLESEADQYANNEPADIKELADKRMESNRKRVANIMDTKESTWSKIINLKTFGVIVLLLFATATFSHFVFGFP